LLTAGGTKKARKKLVSLLVKDLESSLKRGKDKNKGVNVENEEEVNSDYDDGETVYELIRGAPTAIIIRTLHDAEEYRPKWLHEVDSEEEGIGYSDEPWKQKGESSPEETRFFVTLMMSGGGKEGEDYIPKESRKRGKEEKSESDTSSEGDNKEKQTKVLEV
jgi:hypothetical protein